MARRGSRPGKKKLSECRFCKEAGIKKTLGVEDMRVHLYEVHSFNHRLGRVVNKGVMGRPPKVRKLGMPSVEGRS